MINESFKDTVSLVSGGTHGLGLVIAKALAQAGGDVIICGKQPVHLKTAISILKPFGTKVMGFSHDATKPGAVNAIFPKIKKTFGKLDILVNNVGGAGKIAQFADLTTKDWLAAFQLNLMAAVSYSHASIPLLRESLSGRIVNVATASAKSPGLFIPHYSAAKAALLNFSKHLSRALAEDAILVNAVCPASIINTGEWERNAAHYKKDYKEDGAFTKYEQSKNPLKKIATPQDIARAVLFFASPANSILTGVALEMDSGASRSI